MPRATLRQRPGLTEGRPFSLSTWITAIVLSPPLLTLGLAPTVIAGVIDPPFARYLATLPAEEPVSVMLMLAEQAPLASLDARLRAERATPAVRHELVVSTLREVAVRTQPPLLSELDARKAVGEVRGYTPYWIANLVIAEMTVDAVIEVAARPDIDIVYANFTVSLIEPVRRAAPPQQDVGTSGFGSTTPGLRAVNAPRVWSELGITGSGRLVCGLDTGVMVNHVALMSRWRGAHVPWQHAWLDLLEMNTQVPTDTHGHGTHTMGTMTALGAANGDTVGVAFGAEWIACNAINQGVGPEFDNDVIAAFQWIADPDGNPQTVSDVPDVVQNSWRINELFPGGYTDCDPRWWAVIDACEAAGCAVVFSAGNEGPGAQTIGSPPDRISTPTNAFAIGAVDATDFQFPYPIATFSSRGPSGCDGATKKPEVVAPGVMVISCTNDGSYGFMDGTSMSGPHVSGVCALMREANPNLDVATMKGILMSTARDLGTAGEDNTFGWGHIDAYAAVQFVLQSVGEIHGTVTHAVTGDPIAGATVIIAGVNSVLTTGASGAYRGFAPAGTYDVTASHPAFLTTTESGVKVGVGSQVTLDFSLDPAPDELPPLISDTTCIYATDDTVGPYAIGAAIADNLEYVVASLHYRTSQVWDEVRMEPQGGNRFEGTIPGQPWGTQVDYFIEARDAQQNTTTDPPGAPGIFLTFQVAPATKVFGDDAEQNLGWILGLPEDTALTGRWVRENPVGTSAPPAVYQPEDDHTPAPGVTCFVTGNAPQGAPPDENDVDFGCTTLLSPPFDLSGAHEAVLRYWRWYANADSLDDVLSVDISSDGGQAWHPLEQVGPGSRQPWLKAEHFLRCRISLTSTMRLRFTACDLKFPSLTEAGIDDVSIGRFAEPVGIPDPPAAPVFQTRLTTARPNPFSPFTLVTYEIAERGKVELRLYDVSGRLVRTLVDGMAEIGVHDVVFDGRDGAGHDLASGIYFLRLTAGASEKGGKLTVILIR